MAIFNKEYTLFLLNEMKTKEEYSRRSFKKKYKFEPSENNKGIGKIKVDGKEYNVDIRNRKYSVPKNIRNNIKRDIINITKDNKNGEIADALLKSDNKISTSTAILNNNKNSKITLDKKFFKLKGSNNNERRDAILQHEIGHQHDKNDLYKDKNNEFERIKFHKIAKKYNNDDVDDTEFIADRYSANHTSERASKNALKNYIKLSKKEENKLKSAIIDDNGKYRLATPKEKKKEINSYNSKAMSQMKQRFKALKDPELRKYKG